MSNVVEIKTRPASINESVVARLEEVLADAKAGKITSIAIAGLEVGGDIIAAWSETDDFGRLLGAIARLQYRINANQAIERVINFFEAELHDQIYAHLSLNLRGIVSQRLIPRADGKGRGAAIEIMLNTPRIADLISKGEIAALKPAIEAGHQDGSCSFDQALYDLFRQRVITLDQAIAHADSANNLRLRVKMDGAEAGAEKATFALKKEEPEF
jgi:Tfp pilus assembly ATPase PilU